MAIINKDGFDFYDDLNGNPEAIILKGVYLEKEIDYIIDKKIKSIALNYFDSKSITNLKFIEKINFIEKVSIADVDISLQELYTLTCLKELSINIKNKSQYLDFLNFPKLEYLSIDWYKNFPDLSKNEKLKKLYIWKFKPESKSFKGVLLPENLELMHITETNIESMEGLDVEKIKQFEAYFCSKLTSLGGIEKISKSLNTLILENCKNLKDYSKLWECKEIKKMILSDSGEIESLKKLPELDKLKMFTFMGTNIVDGDVSNCKGIDYVYFNNAKHYNHKVKEFEKV